MINLKEKWSKQVCLPKLPVQLLQGMDNKGFVTWVTKALVTWITIIYGLVTVDEVATHVTNFVLIEYI